MLQKFQKIQRIHAQIPNFIFICLCFVMLQCNNRNDESEMYFDVFVRLAWPA